MSGGATVLTSLLSFEGSCPVLCVSASLHWPVDGDSVDLPSDGLPAPQKCLSVSVDSLSSVWMDDHLQILRPVVLPSSAVPQVLLTPATQGPRRALCPVCPLFPKGTSQEGQG